MAKINEIDITSLTYQEGSVPSTPASTKWKIYAKTDGFYQVDDAGSETSLAGAGSGGLTLGTKGYETAGGSWLALTNARHYCKSVSLTAGDIVLGFKAYMKSTANNVAGPNVGIWTNGTSQPAALRAVGGMGVDQLLLNNNVTARWLHFPIFFEVPTTATYWFGIGGDTPSLNLAYDGSGSDGYLAAGGTWIVDSDSLSTTWTSETNKYSMALKGQFA